MSKFFAVLLFALACVFPASVRAAEDSTVLFVKSKYFSVYGPPQMDVLGVLNKINYDYFLQVDNLLAKKNDDPKFILGETVDAVFRQASKVLGINVYSFEATLQILPDQDTIKLVIKKLVGAEVHERGFYLDESKTVYMSLEDMTAGILGHEMAHALICHYFGAPPAANLQEILAGYVDYSFSKEISKRPVS